MSRRTKLPYRETSDCFLLFKDKLVARVSINSKTKAQYISFPGGGIDENEKLIAGATRECMEEVGAKLKKNSLKLIHIVCWDWFEEWADTPKRKERYKQFRGEKVHLLIREVDKFVKPMSDEGDEWIGKKTISLSKAIKVMNDTMCYEHANILPYKTAQLTILNMMKKMNIPNVKYS